MTETKMTKQELMRLLWWKLDTNPLAVPSLTTDEYRKIQNFKDLLDSFVSMDRSALFPIMFELKKTQFIKLAREVWAIYYNNGGIYNNHIFEPLLEIKFKKSEVGCGEGFEEEGEYCIIDLYYNLRLVKGKWKIIDNKLKSKKTKKSSNKKSPKKSSNKKSPKKSLILSL